MSTKDRTLQVALVQDHLIWQNPKANCEHFAEKLQKLKGGVDLIALPEMFTTGFTMHPEQIEREKGHWSLQWMQRQAAHTNAALVGSIPFFEDGAFTNRLFFVRPDGTFDFYDKRHTFTLAGEDKVYKAGTKKLILEYKGFRICPLICYDLRFPVWARNTENYDILLYVANWPKPRITAWDTLLKARAIENMAYCIGVNRIGIDAVGHEYPGHSAVYDGLGEALVFSKEVGIHNAALSKAHLEAIRTKLRFLEDRDAFTLKV